MKRTVIALVLTCAATSACEAPRQYDTRGAPLGERLLVNPEEVFATQNDGEGTFFGTSVAATDEWLVVGSPQAGEDGEVWIFRNDETYGMIPVEWFAPAFPRAGARFGARVALDGSVMAAVAPAQGGDTGTLHIYESTDGVWARVAVHEWDGDGYGAALVVDGDLVVVGAPDTPTGSTGVGAFHTYARDVPGAGDWGFAGSMYAEPGVMQTGAALALDDEQLYVGAPGNAGAVRWYLYTPSADSLWSSQGSLIPAPTLSSGSRFGTSVALTAASVYVGAPLDDAGGNDAGTVIEFERASNDELTRLDGASLGAGAQFGTEVAVRDEFLAVTAPGADEWADDVGAIYVYEDTGLDYQLVATPQAVLDTTGAAAIGSSPSFNTDTLFCGHADEDYYGVDSGYVAGFDRDSDGDGQPDFERAFGSPNPRGLGGLKAGEAVSLLGDRLVVGATHNDELGFKAGAVYLSTSRDGGWSDLQKLPASRPVPLSRTGYAVTQTGDEVFAGAPGSGTGRVYRIDVGGVTGSVAEITHPEAQDGSYFGATLDTDGETLAIGELWGKQLHLFRNDGAAWTPYATLDRAGRSVDVEGDLLVTGFEDTDDTQGARLYERTASETWELVTTLEPPETVEEIGAEVALGEGVVFVYAPGATAAEADEDRGAVHVFVLDGTTWSFRRTLRSTSDAEDTFFGRSIDVEGDIAAMGAHGETIGEEENAGAVYLFGRHVGGPNNWGLLRRVTADPPDSWTYFGTAVDLDGGRLAVGAPRQAGAVPDAGVVHVLSSPEMNGAPVANDDEVVRDPEMADIPIDPLANDTDPDGDGLFVVLDGTPAGGDVAVATDGTLVYTPGPDFTGSDSFTYRASDVFTESGPATVVIRSDRASCGPPPCPDGEVCFAQACFAQCDDTEQCGNGESCYDDRCAVSACEGVECTDGEVCYGGACFESCDDDTCSSGQCYDGRCARDPCDDVTCAVGSICVGGGCFEACDDDGECSGENSCIDGRCAANACDGIQCATGQTCVGGACFDSCSVDDDCGAGEVCDDGACRMPAECQSDDCVDGGCCATVEAPAVDRLPTLIVALLLWVGWRRRD